MSKTTSYTHDVGPPRTEVPGIPSVTISSLGTYAKQWTVYDYRGGIFSHRFSCKEVGSGGFAHNILRELVPEFRCQMQDRFLTFDRIRDGSRLGLDAIRLGLSCSDYVAYKAVYLQRIFSAIDRALGLRDTQVYRAKNGIIVVADPFWLRQICLTSLFQTIIRAVLIYSTRDEQLRIAGGRKTLLGICRSVYRSCPQGAKDREHLCSAINNGLIESIQDGTVWFLNTDGFWDALFYRIDEYDPVSNTTLKKEYSMNGAVGINLWTFDKYPVVKRSREEAISAYRKIFCF